MRNSTRLSLSCYVNGVKKVPLAFCCPFWTEVNAQLSPPHFHSEDRLEPWSVQSKLGTRLWMLVCWASVCGLLSVPAVEHQEVFRSWVDHRSISNASLRCQSVFSNSSYYDRTVNCCNCWNADLMSMSASDWFRRPPSFTTLFAHSFLSTPACPGTHIKWTTFSVFLAVMATSFSQFSYPPDLEQCGAILEN